MNQQIIAWIDRTFYPTFKHNWDNDYFREISLPYLDPKTTTLLDLGAGRGAMTQMNFKDKVLCAIGVDPEDVVHTNPYLHESYVGFGDSMPFLTAGRCDVIVCNNVLEHIDKPNEFYAELGRVTKSGGICITKTPNFYYYVPIIAHLTPTAFHKWYNAKRGRPTEDTFPTRYLANTYSDQKRYAEQNGFVIEQFLPIEGRPEYLRLTFPTYFVGLIYERIVNVLGLDFCKSVIVTVLRKK